MQGELTSRLSSSWMYIAYIFLLFDLFSPLCWWLTKRGRKILSLYILSLYMHIWVFAYIEFMHFTKWGEWFWKFKQKGGESFWEKNFWFMHISLTLFMHKYLFSFMHFIEYLIVYWHAWVKWELLWSLSLIHAYITLWVLSSSKRERLFAQRPITLVLMMINSCSYSLLMILSSYSFSY